MQTCARCAKRLDELRDLPETQGAETQHLHAEAWQEAAKAVELRKGELLGRYVVLALLGKGGMGAVYEAFDPELGRKVAVKLLHAAGPRSGSDEATRRLLREAHAMARLSHPNVASIYDVGSVGARVFVAMELVQGANLRKWLTDGKRSWKETLRVLVDAGRGLAAAHAAGLIHRDVKPDNILVSKDGAAKITDFGLARREGVDAAWDDASTSSMPPAMSREPSDWLSRPLTVVGSVVGTYNYMSPEQLRGDDLDARGDLYAFCVTAYEALYGARPYDRDQIVRLERGEALSVPRPARTSVPAWVHAALVRGLSPEPDDRQPSMAELLGALTHDPWDTRRRWILGGIALAALVATGPVYRSISSRQEKLCQGGAQRVQSLWDPGRKVLLHEAFTRTGKPFADASWDAASRMIDTYTKAWAGMRTEACEATRVHGEQPEPIMALRMACLDARLVELGALTELWSHADADDVSHAPAAAAALPGLGACADVEGLVAEVPPPEDGATRAKVADARGRLAKVKAEYDSGKYAAAEEGIGPIVAAAKELDYPPLVAEVLELRGRLASAEGKDMAAPVDALYEAEAAAEAGRSDALKARVSIALIGALSAAARHADAHRQVGYARAVVRRLHGNDELTARLEAAEADLFMLEGDYPDALPILEKAVLLLPRVASNAQLSDEILESASKCYDRSGQYQAARDLAQRALDLDVRELGPVHPSVARAWESLGVTERDLGHTEKARAAFERVLEIDRSVFGEDSMNTGVAHYSLGIQLHDEGAYRAAVVELEQALKVFERLFGSGSVKLAGTLGAIASCLSSVGEELKALAYAERADALVRAEERPDSQRAYFAAATLGDLLADMGRFAEAEAALRRAIAIGERQGTSWPDAVPSTGRLVEVLLEEGRTAEAMKWAEKAVALSEATAEKRPELTVRAFVARSYARDASHQVELAREDAERAAAAAKTFQPTQSAALVALVQLGKTRIATGDVTGGRADLERAAELVEDPRAPPYDRAKARAALAITLAETGSSRERARSLAADAEKDYRDLADPVDRARMASLVARLR